MAGDALFGTKLTKRTKLVQKITPESKHPFKFVIDLQNLEDSLRERGMHTEYKRRFQACVPLQ